MTGCGAPVAYASMPASSCGTTTATQKVWVPNVKTETVPVTTSVARSQEVSYTVYEQQTTQIPYECTTMEYRAETRTGTKKVVDYVDEERTRTRKEVQYNEETRTRTRKQLTYDTVTKTETVPYVTYETETKTKEVSYTYNVPEYVTEPYETTRYERVAEEQVEEYTVTVPVTVMKEEQVQVCKMVPELVEDVIYPCGGSSSVGIVGSAESVSGAAVAGGCGCGSTVPAASAGCGGCGATVSASPCGCN